MDCKQHTACMHVETSTPRSKCIDMRRDHLLAAANGDIEAAKLWAEVVDHDAGGHSARLTVVASAAVVEGLGAKEEVLGAVLGWGRVDLRTGTPKSQSDHCLHMSLTSCRGMACCTPRSWWAQHLRQWRCRRSTARRLRHPRAHSRRQRTAACTSASSGLDVGRAAGSGTGVPASRDHHESTSPSWRHSGR